MFWNGILYPVQRYKRHENWICIVIIIWPCFPLWVKQDFSSWIITGWIRAEAYITCTCYAVMIPIIWKYSKVSFAKIPAPPSIGSFCAAEPPLYFAVDLSQLMKLSLSFYLSFIPISAVILLFACSVRLLVFLFICLYYISPSPSFILSISFLSPSPNPPSLSISYIYMERGIKLDFPVAPNMPWFLISLIRSLYFQLL